MPCALCGKDAVLRNSHIIPEFMYKALYDELHRFQVLTTVPGGKDVFLQKGLRERLLCDSCEEMLSKYERYASLILGGGIELQFERFDKFLVVKGIDYQKFKLFQMSVLWRASVAKQDMFKEVSLNVHEEKIRKMILAGDPGRVNEYGCIMYALTANGSPLSDLIDQPQKIRFIGYNSYRFTFGGFVWTYVVSSHFMDKDLEQAFLQPDEMYILQKDFREFRPLVDFGLALRKNNKPS